jgi:hypothetical protein
MVINLTRNRINLAAANISNSFSNAIAPANTECTNGPITVSL